MTLSYIEGESGEKTMDRQRLTITLKKEVIHQVDRAVDGTKIRNRSHAIEYLLSKALGPRISQAFILAGGQGIKMRPFTYEMPKPMIPVHNRPILEQIIELLREYNVRDIIISIDYLGQKIKDHFGDGSRFGVKITYIEGEKPVGTAAPLVKAKNLFGNNAFLMLHGDVLADIDLTDLVEFHESHKGLITMALTSVADPSLYGSARLRGPKVVNFQEKIGRGPEVSRLVNAGIYVVDPKVIDYIPRRKVAFFEKDVFPQLAKKGQIYGYVFEGQWFDVATPDIYARVLKEWKK